MARKKLGEILIQAGVLEETKLKSALAEQARWGGPLGRILVDMRLISEETLVQALSHQLNFPAIRIEDRKIPREALSLVPVDLCEQHGLIPFNLSGKFLDVAMADPTNLGIIDELRIRTRLNVRAYLAGPKSIERAIALNYRGEAVDAHDDGIDAEGLEMLDLEAEDAPSRSPRRRDPLGLAATAASASSEEGVPSVPAPPSLTGRAAYETGGVPLPGETLMPEPSGHSPGTSGRASAGTGSGLPAPSGGLAAPSRRTDVPPPVPPGATRRQGGSPAAPAGGSPSGPVRLAPLVPEGAEPSGQRRDEILALQQRMQQLEALVARDEDVLRKLMGLLIQKGLCTRDEILERIK